MSTNCLCMMHSGMKTTSLLAQIFTVFFTLSLLAGCDSQPTTPETIGILLFGDSRQPQVDGFIAEMNKANLNNTTPIRYIIRNAKNNRSKLIELVNELADEKPNLMVAAGGLEADTMKKVLGIQGIPVVVLYVNAIVERGLVINRHHAGWNVTGVDNLNAELSGKRIELIHKMLPETRRILILYYKKIAPSRIGVEEAIATANKIGIKVDARAVKSRAEILAVMKSLQPDKVDAMLTVPTAPIDNALKDIILPEVRRLKLPLFKQSRPLAELGALASYGAGFYELGQQSARLAQKILKGVDTTKIPFETPKRFIYSLNEGEQKLLGIELSEITKHQVNEFVTTRR